MQQPITEKIKRKRKPSKREIPAKRTKVDADSYSAEIYRRPFACKYTKEMGPKLVELVKGGMSFYGASAELGIVYSTMRSWAETIPEFGGFFAIAKQYWTEHLIQGGLNNTLSAPMCLGMLRMTCGFMDEDRRQMLELKKKEIEMIPMLNTLPTFIEASTSNKTVDEHLQEAKKTIGKELNVGTVYTEIKLK